MKNRNDCGKINRRNPLFKRLAVLLVLLFCVEGVWGTDYRFRKSTNAEKNVANVTWSEYQSWKYDRANDSWTGPTNGRFPGNDINDNVYFFGENECTCNVEANPKNSLNNIVINKTKKGVVSTGSTAKTTIDLSSGVSLTTTSLEIAGGTFNLTGAGTLNVGTLNVTGNVTVAAGAIFNLTGTGTLNVIGNLNIAAGASLVIDEGVTLKVGGSITGSGNITNSGTISCNSITCNALNQTATGTIKDFTSITSESIGTNVTNRFAGTLIPKAGAAATITVTNAIYNESKISDSATGSLTISADGLDTSGKISLTNASSSVTLKGALIDKASGSVYQKVNLSDFTFYNGIKLYAGNAEIKSVNVTSGNGILELKGGVIDSFVWNSTTGGTLEINEVTEIKTLSLSGVAGNPLKVTGTGTITSTQTVSAAGDYLKFENPATPKVKGSGYFFLKNSEDSAGGTTAFPEGWKTPGSVYIWKGTVNDVLTNVANWEGGFIPTRLNGTEDVIIDTATGGYNPNVTAGFNLNFKSLSVSSSSTLDLNAGNLTLTGFLENEGTISNAASISVSGNLVTSGTLNATTISVLNTAVSTNTVDLSGTVTGKMNVAGNLDVNINSEISGLIAFNVPDSGNSLTNDFTVTLKGNGSLKTGSIEVTRASSAAGVKGKLSVSVPVELSGNLTSHSGTEIEINKSVQAKNYIHDAWSSPGVPESKITVTGSGSLTVSDTIDLCLNGGAVNGDSGSQLNVLSGGTVTTKDLVIKSQYTNGSLSDAVVNAGTITVSGNLTNASSFNNGNAITVTGTLSNSGTWSGSGAVTVIGDFSDSGTWSGTGMITLSGASDQTLVLNAATTYPAFTLSGAGAKNFAGTWKSTGITQNADITFTGDTTFSPDTFTSNSGVINFAPGAGNEMTFNTVSDSDNPFMAELVFVNGTTKAGRDLYFGKDVTIKLDAILSDNGNKLYLRRSTNDELTFTDENTVNSGLSCTGDFTIASNAKIVTGGKTAFNNLAVSKDKALTTTSSFSVVGNMESRGTLNLNGGSIDCTGNFTVGSNGKLNQSAGALKVGGNLIVNIEGSDKGSVSVTGGTISLAGDFTNNGTFSATAGTVTFTGDSKTVSGDNTFYDVAVTGNSITLSGDNTFHNVTVSGVSGTFSGENTFNDLSFTGIGSIVKFGAGKTQTINGNLTVTGGSGTGETITLTTDSVSPDVSDTSTWWKIDVPSGNVTLSYTDVKYSSSVNNLLLQLGDGIIESEPGSTSNWFIRKYYWFGGQDTNWQDGRNWSVKTDGSVVLSQASYPDFNNSLSEIVITEKTGTNHSLALTASEYKIKSVSLNENAIIDLAGNKLTAQSFTNKGTVSLGGGSGTTLNISKSYENGSSGTIVSEGTETVVLPDTSVTGNTIIESGTWEFTGGTISVFPQAGNIYYALVINGDVSIETVSAVSAKIKAGKSLSLGNNSLSLSGALTNSGTLNINGSGSVTTGSVTNSGTIDISGSGTINKLNSDSGLVKYSGSAGQTILSFIYHNLELANTSAAGLSVTDNVTVSNSLLLSENSIVTVSSGKTVTVSGTSDTANGTETLTLSGAGSANFAGAVGSTKTVPALTASISNLSFENTVSIGSLVIDGTTTLDPGTSAEFTNITINDGKKLSSSGNVKISGIFSDLNTGGSGLSSTVTFTGTDSKIVTSSDRTKFNNIFVQKGKALTTTSSFEVSGNFGVEQDAATPPVPRIFTATAGTIVFSGNLKTVSGACGFYDVSFGENSSISISNDNSFHDVSFGKGAAVTFANGTTQTVSGKVVSNGETGDGNSVTLKSESGYWNINFDQNNAGNKLEYLNIKNSIFTGSNGPAVALKSVDGGNNTDWIFPGKVYTWTAGAPSDADKTKWDVKENWSPSTIPGKGAVVTIPKEKSKYPVLTANLDLYYDSNSKGSITIIADGTTPGSLDLGTYSLKAGEITNNGVLRLEGSDLKLDKLTNNALLKLQGNEDFGTHGASSEFGVSSVISGDNSTVEYYGTTASASGWLNKSDEYKNLVIDSGTEFTAATYTRGGVETKKTKTGILTNNGKVIVPSDITLEFVSYTGTSDEIEITNGTINHTGSDNAVIENLKVAAKAVLNGTTASEKTLSAANITYDTNPALETSGNVKLPGGSIGALKLSSGNLSFESDVTINGDYDGTGGTLNGSTEANPLITFKGDVTFGNFTHNGDSVLFTSAENQSLTTNDQVFADVEFNSTGTDKKYTVTGLLHVQGNLTNTKGLSESVNLKISGTSGLKTTAVTGVKKVNNFEVENTSTEYTKTVLFLASGNNPPQAGSGLSVSGNFVLTGADRGTDGKSIKLSAQGTPSEDIATWWYLENVDLSKVTVSNAEIGYAYSAVDLSGKTNIENPTCIETLDATTSAYTTYHWFADHKYYWFGGTGDNNWAAGGNWSVKETGTPVLAQGPKHDDETISVYINGGAVSSPEKQLVLDRNITVKEFQIASDVRTDLKNFTVTSETFANNGILVIDGSIASPLIKANATSGISHGTSSAVEYNGWTSGIAINTTYAGLGLTDFYNNLLVNGTGEFKYTDTTVLKVGGTFESGSGVTKITTNGNQIFESTVTLNDTTGTTLGAGGNNTITLNGNVTSSGNAAFGSPVVLGENIQVQADGKNISFEKNVTGTEKTLTLDGPVNLTLQGAVNTADLILNGSDLAVTAGTSEAISVTGPLHVNNGGTVSVSSPLNVSGTSGNVFVKEGTTLAFEKPVSVSGNVTNSGTFSIGDGSTVSVKGDVTNNAAAVMGSSASGETLEVAGKLTDNGNMTGVEKILFNGTQDSVENHGVQEFNPNSENKYQTLEINNGKNFSVTKALKTAEIVFTETETAETVQVEADSVSVVKADSVLFDGNLKAENFADSLTAGNITFNGSETHVTAVGNSGILLTSGTVTFNNAVTVSSNLTHTAGSTHFGGTYSASLTASGKDLTFGTVVLEKNTGITANNVDFQGTVESKSGEAFDFTVNGNDVSFQ